MPVVVEVFLEKVTNIAMGTELTTSSSSTIRRTLSDAPTAAALLAIEPISLRVGGTAKDVGSKCDDTL